MRGSINMANLTMPLFINTIMEFRPTMRPFPNGVATTTPIFINMVQETMLRLTKTA